MGKVLIACEISIHAAREGGDGGGKMKYCKYLISIHAAREGGDIIEPIEGYCYRISIHAAREGGDAKLKNITTADGNFNPRRP